MAMKLEKMNLKLDYIKTLKLSAVFLFFILALLLNCPRVDI